MSKDKNASGTPVNTQVTDSKTFDAKKHPSRVLGARKNGYGIGGGYERPLKQTEKVKTDNRDGLYGPVPLSGYYGGGTADTADTRFRMGQAGFLKELAWYRAQFGEETALSKKKEE